MEGTARGAGVNGFFFFYTLVILVVCIGAGLLQFAAAGATRSRAHVALGSFFLLYFCELGAIFLEEFLSQNIAFPEAAYYEIINPVARTALSTLLLGALWAAALCWLERFDVKRWLLPTGAFLAAHVACVALLPYGAVRQFLYYTCRQVFLAFMLVYAWRSLASEPKDRPWLIGAKKWLTWMAVGLVAITAEDLLVIIVLDPLYVASLPLYLAERNFAENVMLPALAWVSCAQALDVLQFRLRQPPAPAPAKDGADETFTHHRDERLPRFAEQHGLTAREREVLALVLENKSNTEMADELFLSVGTVKTHVHNIVKKAGAKSRDDLRRNFWETA